MKVGAEGRLALASRMRPVFADPKTDFTFQRIFGTEEHRAVPNLRRASPPDSCTTGCC